MLKRDDTTKHRHHWTEKEMRDFIGLYMKSEDVKAIADHFGVTIASVSKMATRLRQEGVPLPRRNQGHIAGRRNQRWTQEEVEYVVRRRRERATAESIAIDLGRSFFAVQGMILKLRAEGVDVGMLGQGVRRLWCPERLKVACAGRGLALVQEAANSDADDATVKALRRVLA